MIVNYYDILVMCMILLFLKSFAYGNFIQLKIAENHNNKYFKKHKSKNFLINYFYIDYFHEIIKVLFAFNFLLPIISCMLFVVESIVFIAGVDSLIPLGNICFGIAGLFALISFVFSMIYSWITSEYSIITIILAIILILLPVLALLL